LYINQLAILVSAFDALGERPDGGLRGSNGAVNIGIGNGNNFRKLFVTIIVQL
jgi:hypothetical protein